MKTAWLGLGALFFWWGRCAALSPGSDPGTGLTGPNGFTCSSPPPVLSYHIHAVWDGGNQSLTAQAEAKWNEFSTAMDQVGAYASEATCPFSHPNASSEYPSVCAFPTNFSGTKDPWTGEGLFGGANYAFFVPLAHAVVAMNWWRQYHEDVYYMMHVNTGCENEDHSVFAMKNMEYPEVNQSLTGLWCCHEGPPSCTCDIVQYELLSGSTGCLVGDVDTGALSVEASCDGEHWSTGTWRDTTYTDSLRQVEIYGDAGTNVFLCVGSMDGTCAEGAPLDLVDCSLVDSASSRFFWDPTEQKLASDSCSGLCMNATSSGAVVFATCDEASTWNRIYLD